MPIERKEMVISGEVAKNLHEILSQIRMACPLIRGEIPNGVCYPLKGAPTITNSAPKDAQVSGEKNLFLEKSRINVETRTQNQTTSQLIRGEIPSRVCSPLKGASTASISTPKDV